MTTAEQRQRDVLTAAEKTVKRFCEQYLQNKGVRVHVKTEMGRRRIPVEGFDDAFQALHRGTDDWTNFSPDVLVNHAPTLYCLVGWAKLADSSIIPPNIIPAPQVVAAALALFHASRQ